MPELPEVETVCRVLRHSLVGSKLVEVELAEDPIVVQHHDRVEELLDGATVKSVGRKGKYFWLALDNGGFVAMHLGMSGWVRDTSTQGTRLLSHGKAPLDDKDGRPRHLKLLLRAANGNEAVMTDSRRFGRIWPSEGPDKDPRLTALGPDALDDTPSAKQVEEWFKKKTAPVKAALLDQSLFAGVGNWVADEVLYQVGIAPARLCKDVTAKECEKLVRVLHEVLEHAVKVQADASRYPDSWLFGVRWGGKKGAVAVAGEKIVRETVAGRTTAWVPTKQK